MLGTLNICTNNEFNWTLMSYPFEYLSCGSISKKKSFGILTTKGLITISPKLVEF